VRQTNTYIRVSDFFTACFFFLNICLIINREGGRGQWQRQRQRQRQRQGQERHHARSLKLSNLILYIYFYLSYHFLNSLSYPLCFTNQIHITKHVIFPLNMFFRKHQIFGAMITAEMHLHYLFDDIPLNMFFREHQIFGAMNR